MPAVVQAHAQDGIAGLDHRGVCGVVRLGAGMGLHICETRTEQLLRAIARKVFHKVDLLAAAVIALAGIAFGVLIGEHASHGLHYRRGSEVLGSDQFDAGALAVEFRAKGRGNRRIGLGYVIQGHGILLGQMTFVVAILSPEDNGRVNRAP